MNKKCSLLYILLIASIFVLSGCSISPTYGQTSLPSRDILDIPLGEDISDSKLQEKLDDALLHGETQFFINYNDSASLEREVSSIANKLMNTNYLASCLLEEVEVNYHKVLGAVQTVFSLHHAYPDRIPTDIQLIEAAPHLETAIEAQFQDSIEPLWILLKEEYAENSDALFEYMDNADSNASALTCEAAEFYLEQFDSDGEQTLLLIGRNFPVEDDLLLESRAILLPAIKEQSEALHIDTSDQKAAYESIVKYVMEKAYYDDQNANYILQNTKPSDPQVYLNRTAYGVFITGQTICTGYAKAVKAICDEVGLPCRIVFGEMAGVPHAWNAVKLNDEIYYIDATVADTGTSLTKALWLTEADLKNALYELSAAAKLLW